ncbi:hypothetical protein HanPI659440_Chr06g0251241 [Helianthus annuus]|nr:hypothetical protein HanPI659440_Chr06g0251241 [Helianthus annuus]
MFKQYMGKLIKKNGKEVANNIISNSVFFISASSNDFLLNYFSFPTRRSQYDVRAYNDIENVYILVCLMNDTMYSINRDVTLTVLLYTR